MYFIDSLHPPPPILMSGHRGMLVHKVERKGFSGGDVRAHTSGLERPEKHLGQCQAEEEPDISC